MCVNFRLKGDKREGKIERIILLVKISRWYSIAAEIEKVKFGPTTIYIYRIAAN